MWNKLVAIFTGRRPETETKQVVDVVVPPPTPTTEEEMREHRFVFPETLVAYKVEKARLREEIPAAFQMCQRLSKEFNLWFAANKGQTTDAIEMLKRRQTEKEWRSRVEQAEATLKKLEDESSWLETVLQRKERERYLSEGREIYRGEWADHVCRVVVQWHDKVLLLTLQRKSVVVDLKNRPAQRLNHEYEPPFVEWATDSLAQFTNEELEAVARFQSGTANQ